MATSILYKINNFLYALGTKTHNLSSDSFKIALTNTAHTASWTKLSDLTEISYTNCSSRALTITSWSQTSGTAKLIFADITLTASGGSVGPFRYVYIYNDTATNKDLVCYYDYGSALTLGDSDTFPVDLDGTNGIFTNV